MANLTTGGLDPRGGLITVSCAGGGTAAICLGEVTGAKSWLTGGGRRRRSSRSDLVHERGGDAVALLRDLLPSLI